MNRKLRPAPGLFLALVSLIAVWLTGARPACAVSSSAGTGPGDAAWPPSDWVAVSTSESHWYGFDYVGDGSEIQIQMQVEPQAGTGFGVWTPHLIERWGRGEYVEPIGRGSVEPFASNTLSWTGSFAAEGTYYVVVERTGAQAGSSYYLLEVSGAGVSPPYSAPAGSPTPAPAKATMKRTLPSEIEGKLVFQATFGGEIYTIGVDGSGLQRITTGIDPVWSPAGEQVAFTRWEEPRGVYVINADGSGELRLFDWNETRWPSWSYIPSGESSIVFSRQDGGRQGGQRCFRGRCFTRPANPHWRLGTVNPADGAFAEPVTDKQNAQAASWSPDGDLLVYSGERGLEIESVDGVVSYALTANAKDASAGWSPLGDEIVFVRLQHDHWEIYSMDATDSTVVRLTSTPFKPDGTAASSVSPAWSPDGGHIAFLTDRTGRWEIWVMRADGSNQRPMFDTELQALTLQYSFVGERAISWAR